MLAHENYSLPHKVYSTKRRTASQWAALAHLRKCGHLFGILPVAQGQAAADRVRTCDWISWLDDLSLCYTGEMVLPAQRLALRQVLPSLPPDEYKGTVEAIVLRRRAVVADPLADPNGLLLPVQRLLPQLGHTFLPRLWKGMPSGGPFLRTGSREPVEADRVAVVRAAVRQREGAERRFQRADEGSAHPLRSCPSRASSS